MIREERVADWANAERSEIRVKANQSVSQLYALTFLWNHKRHLKLIIVAVTSHQLKGREYVEKIHRYISVKINNFSRNIEHVSL